MKLNIESTLTNQLIPYANNARSHSDGQVDQIVASISEFGFVNPVLISENKEIIAGHGRVLAAKRLGLEMVPTITLTHLSEDQRRALVIADNKLAENASWDSELLGLELQDLIKQDFDIDLLGFTDIDLDSLLSDIEEASEKESIKENIPEPTVHIVSQVDDIWILGKHRLVCGDATNEKAYNALMQGKVADMVFTDPPYNINYRDGRKIRQTHLTGNTTILNDNLGESFGDFLKTFFEKMLVYVQGSIYVCLDLSELNNFQRIFSNFSLKLSAIIIWVKNHFTAGYSDYRRQYEAILYGHKKGSNYYWCDKRDQSDTWFHDRPTNNNLHPTMKPVPLVAHAINNSSGQGGVVLDPFGGSGSTLIACEQTNRKGRLMELDPRYVDVIVKRWQEMTGENAYHEPSGQTFNERLNTQLSEQTA